MWEKSDRIVVLNAVGVCCVLLLLLLSSVASAVSPFSWSSRFVNAGGLDAAGWSIGGVDGVERC